MPIVYKAFSLWHFIMAAQTDCRQPEVFEVCGEDWVRLILKIYLFRYAAIYKIFMLMNADVVHSF